MKTPTARKQAARRAVAAAAAAHKPIPLRDQNRLAPSGGDAVPAPLPKQHAVEASLKTPTAPLPPAPQPPLPPPPPAPQQPEAQAPPASVLAATAGAALAPAALAPAAAPRPDAKDPKDEAVAALRRRLKHATAAFDALAIVLQHSIKTVEFLCKDERHADYNVIKAEWQTNSSLLGEIKEKVVSLENALVEEKIRNSALLTEKENEISKLREEFDSERLKWVENTQAKVTSLEEKHQAELESLHKCASEHQTLLAERDMKLKVRSEEWTEKQKQLEATIGQLRTDHERQEKTLQEQITLLKSENCRLCNQLNIYAESSSKDSRLQACMSRCTELEEDVKSLETVLELRHKELQELRRRNGILQRQAEQLPGALQRATLLQTRVEDLQAQVKEKLDYERQMSKEQTMLLEALQKEVKKSSRLTLLTEELQWKLKQNTEVVNAFVNGSNTNNQVPSTSGSPSPSVCRRNTNGTLHSISESSNSNNLAYSEIPSCLLASKAGSVGSLGSSRHRTGVEEDGGASPPPSPKIKGVVEKNDSVSWILDLEESSEELMSRLIRRAGSFRGSTTPPTTVVKQAQTLPPPKRRSKAGLWSPSPSNALRRSNSKNDNTSTPKNSTRSRSRSVSADSVDGIEFLSWGLNRHGSPNNEIISVKNTENSMCHDTGVNIVLWNNSASKESPKHGNMIDDWNCMMPVFSNDESPTKSSGSSDCTSSDECIRNNEDCNSPNTANLALLAACSAVQPPLLPKDAAGEAMISENEGDDDDDDDDDEDCEEEEEEDVDNDVQEDDDDHEDHSSSSDSSGLGLQSDTMAQKFEKS